MPMPNRYIDPVNNLYELLSTAGDGTGTVNAIGDYSTPDDFYIQPPVGKLYEINRMIVHIQSASNLKQLGYGSLSALTVGISVIVGHGSTGVLEKMLNSHAIKSNDNWAGQCFDTEAMDYGTGVPKAIAVRWTFSKSGSPIWLNGNNANKLIARLSDDMTGLTEHHFHVQGIIHNI